jgi:hypothetical protein
MFLEVAWCMPYYLLTSSVGKCFTVDVAPSTTITIAYSAPDLALSDDPNEDLSKKRTTARIMNILVTHKLPPGVKPANAREKKTALGGRLKEQLSKREGTIEYTTGSGEGLVEVCAQAASASQRIPLRVAIQVFQGTGRSSAEKLVRKLSQGGMRTGAELLTEHSSRLTSEIGSLSSWIKEISKNAEYFKQKEVSLHDKSVALQNAAKYWPIFRMFVLISAAFLQTHYVVTFMKRRHIV